MALSYGGFLLVMGGFRKNFGSGSDSDIKKSDSDLRIFRIPDFFKTISVLYVLWMESNIILGIGLI